MSVNNYCISDKCIFIVTVYMCDSHLYNDVWDPLASRADTVVPTAKVCKINPNVLALNLTVGRSFISLAS